MAIRNLVASGDPVLRHPASEVKKVDQVIIKLAEDMMETMHQSEGIGLAAPQIGISKQIIVADVGEGEEVKIINPVITESNGRETGLEGCLSLPGIYGEVIRAACIKVEGIDLSGKMFTMEAEGLLARVLQHEIDHLHGMLFTDKATRLVDPEELKTEG